MELATYLKRIQYFDPVKPDVETLHGLQRTHLLTVPFENLDIELRRPIRLDLESLWDKIIVRRRGGFCYEVNGLFAWLLREIDFDVTYLNARVYNRSGELGIPFDHLALLVKIPDEPGRWLADVGFGDSFNEPLNFEERGEQPQGLRTYRLEQLPDGYVTWQKDYDGSWEHQYFFDLQPHQFPADYEASCLYHQTSPKSSFTRSSIISRATPDGRVSLERGKLILTQNGQRSERPLENEAEYHTLLKHYFGFDL